MITNMSRTLLLVLGVSIAVITTRVYGQPDSSSNPRWLLVTTAELAGELEPLVIRRQQQGFEVLKVYRDVQLRRSDWNSQSIRNKISELCREPDRSTYVLLVGDWNEHNGLSYLPPATGKQGHSRGRPQTMHTVFQMRGMTYYCSRKVLPALLKMCGNSWLR